MAQRTPANPTVRLDGLWETCCDAFLSAGTASSQWPVWASLIARWALDAVSLECACLVVCPPATVTRLSKRTGYRDRNIEKGQMGESICPMIQRSIVELQRELYVARILGGIDKPHGSAATGGSRSVQIHPVEGVEEIGPEL